MLMLQKDLLVSGDILCVWLLHEKNSYMEHLWGMYLCKRFLYECLFAWTKDTLNKRAWK